MLQSLRELRDLNLCGNRIAVIALTENPKNLLPKLENLNVGYNDLIDIPEELDEIGSLRALLVMNNCIERVPMRVCMMNGLRIVDVSSNPLIQPPIETCERGICSMRRYYYCLRREEEQRKTKR